MFDIEKVGNDAFKQLVESGAIEAAIQEQVKKATLACINQHFGEYSEFRKQLKAKMETVLAVDLDNGIECYNAMIAREINQALRGLLDVRGRAAIEKIVGGMLSPAPATIAMSELIDLFKKDVTENRYYYARRSDEAKNTVTVIGHKKPEGESIHSAWWLYLGSKPNMPKYDCEVQMMISGDGGVSHIEFKNHRRQNVMFIGDYSGFDLKLWQFHSAKTKITCDVEEPDLYLPEEECHCH